MQDQKNVGLHWFDPFGSVRFQDMINLPPVDKIAQQRIIFWDQEPVYKHTFDKFAEQFKPVYEGPTMLVVSECESKDLAWAKDTYGLSSAYYFFHGWAALDWYRGYDHAFLWPGWQDRVFDHRIFCANNVIGGERSHRVRLVSGMQQRNLIKHNLVSLPDRCPFSAEHAHVICDELNVPYIDDLPLIIDRSANHADRSHSLDFWPWATRSFCHVVTETVYESSRLHLTEKTFKPIVLEQPFVLVAPRGSLCYLRSYGFQTFNSIWSEHYDTLEDDQRIDAILDILQEIDSWSATETAINQQKIANVVQHNKDWFYGGFQDLLWQELTQMISRWRW